MTPATLVSTKGGDIAAPVAASPGTNSGLVRKLAEVMSAVHHVPKRGRNQHFQYDFATESDIVAVVRKELADRYVMLIPQVDEYKIQELPPNKDGKPRDALTILTMTFTFLDGESGESIARPWVGVGQDGGDKGAYKALTGAAKFFLLKTFLIPTGDDPERETGERKTRRVGTPDPPDTFVDATTGEDVPATNRPEAPKGFRYIDEYSLNGQWHEVKFHHVGKQGVTWTYSTKFEQPGALLAHAYQQGIPVRLESKIRRDQKRAAYIDKVELWKPDAKEPAGDAEAPPILASEIAF